MLLVRVAPGEIDRSIGAALSFWMRDVPSPVQVPFPVTVMSGPGTGQVEEEVGSCRCKSTVLPARLTNRLMS